MSKKTFIAETYHVSQYIDAESLIESEVLIIAKGRFVDAIPKKPEKRIVKPAYHFKDRGAKAKAIAKPLYRYYIDRKMGYTHKLPYDFHLTELAESLAQSGYERCSKEEYDAANSHEKGG